MTLYRNDNRESLSTYNSVEASAGGLYNVNPKESLQPSSQVLRYLLENTNMNLTVKNNYILSIHFKTKDYLPHA
jgi:hypothetical protein